MARDGRTAHARQSVKTGRDPKVEFARRLAREPQISALEAVAAWAEGQGVSLASVRGMREVIAVFAADPGAPNLDLAMRARRRRIVREFRDTGRRD